MSAHHFDILHALVVEDDLGMQEEAQRALAVFPGVDVRCARTKADAETLVNRHAFDMAIVDIGLPDGSGIELIRHIMHRWPKTICIARTVFDDDETLFGALAAGAQGYLLKGQPIEHLHAQLIAAARGEPVISPAITRKMLAFFRRPLAGSEHQAQHNAQHNAPPPPTPESPLTRRESEVLTLIGRGMTIAEAAAALSLSDNTVKTHVKSAYGKLNISSRAGAALEAQRLGLLRDRPPSSRQ